MNTTVKEQQQLLWQHNELSNILCIVIGSIGMISNILVVITIGFGSSEVRTKCMKFLLSLGISDIFVCIFFMYTATFQLIHEQHDIFNDETSMACWFREYFWGIFACHANRVITLTVALDRLIAVTIPIKYKMWGNFYVRGMLIGPWIFCLFTSLSLSAFTSNNKRALICAFHTSLVNIKFVPEVWTNVSLGIVLLTMLLYIAIWVIVFYKIRTTRKAAIRELKKLIEFKAILTVSVVIVLHFCCYVTTTILLSYARSSVSKANLMQFNNSLFCLWIFNSACNLGIYLTTNSLFRNSFLEIFCRKADNATGISMVNLSKMVTATRAEITQQ